MRRLICVIALALISHSAWALSFNPPSPTTSGSYTVNFPTRPLGCWDTGFPPFWDCYALYESVNGSAWNVVMSEGNQGATSWSTSGKVAGTYDYMVGYFVNAFPTDVYPVETGQMIVQSENVSFSVDTVTVTEGGQAIFTVTKTGSTSQTTGVSFETYAQGTATSGVDYAVTSGTLSFEYYEATKTFAVNTLQDSTAEYQEIYNVRIHSPTGPATIGSQWGGGYINDDDPVPTVSISDATVVENGDLVFTASLSHPAVYWVNFNVAMTNGSATAGNDYTACCAVSGVAPLGTSTTIVVDTLPDSVFEGTETFTVTLSPLSGGSPPIGDGTGIGTITDDDTVTFSINDPSAAEGDPLSFNVTQNGASVFTHVVSYATGNNTATVADGDYTATSGNLSFPPTSSSSQTLPVTVATLDETPARLEPAQTLFVTLGNGGLNGATIVDSSGTGTITNDDTVTFAINDPAAVVEGAAISFTVTQTGASDFTHVVNFTSANGSATVADGDYTATSGSRSFAPTTSATQTQSVSVTTLDESPTRLEAAQTVLVNLSDGGLNGATIADNSGTGTITDDDSVTLSINDTSVVEGGTLTFTVTQTGGSDFSHSVNYATANNTATTAGGDYTAASGTVTFNPTTSGSQTSPVNVATLDESPSQIESAETLFVNLTSPTGGATISDTQCIGTITDDDAAFFSISDATVTEGGTLSFTVTRGGSTGATNTVQYATANGTATSGSDYTAIALTTLTFTTGQTTQPVTVTTASDGTSEAHETLNVNLSSPSGGATLADALGVGTINNDDAPGAPVSLTGPIGITTATSATLTWTAASGVVTHHEVERTFDGAVTTVNTGSATASYNATGLSTDGAYRFRVRACNSAGNLCGSWSNVHEVVRSNTDATTGAPPAHDTSSSSDAGPSTGLTNFNGLVSGNASVAPSGAAAYTIPIAIPPGTRDMQPSLALAYHSYGGNGTIGRGWALAGASSTITRCDKTLAQDGVIHAVDYSTNDRFCLDGQRLAKTSSAGVYGGDGVKYRTELESFRDVTSNGGTPTSPASFTVRTADGNTYFYGGTANSTFQANGPNAAEVATWLLRRVEDRYGNFYTITYFEDETNGHFHVERIDYSGHASTSSTYASVELTYDPVASPIKRYQSGSVSSVRYRLRKITAKNGPAAVREYVLAYNESETVPVSGMARLTSVKECAPTEAGACTPPTTFDWIDEVGGMQFTGQLSTQPGGFQEWVDVNGDNRTDFVWFSTVASTQHSVALSTGTGFQSPQTWTKGTSTHTEYKFTDVDGDGDSDFVTFGTTSNDHLVSKSNGAGYEPTVAWPAQPLKSGGHAFLDMNGDGRADFVTWQNTGDPDETIDYSISLSTGNGYTNQVWAGPKLAGTPGWEPDSYDFHDVNLDGRTDLVLAKGTTHRIYVNNGTSFDPYFEASTGYVALGQWADLNGDSLQDFVYAGNPSHGVALWTGKSYVVESWSGSPFVSQFVWRDMNGDGLADYVGGGQVGFSTGSGYVTLPAWSGFTGTGQYPEFPDFDGDGKADFKNLFHPTVGYFTNQSQPVHLMRKVTDGLGMETVFTYKPLSDPSVYTKLTNATYPTTDFVNAVHVVSHLAQSSASSEGDGYFDTDYQYKGFKVDKQGRGSLGFAEVTATDVDRKIKTVTTYSQTFPLTGLPLSVDVTVTDKADDGTNVQQVISENDRVFVARNGVTSFDGPPVKLVCLDTDTTIERDLESNALLRTTLTDNDPGNTGVPCDAYGNPGQAGTPDVNGTPLTRRLTVSDHVASVTHRTDSVTYFLNDESNWLLNLPTRQLVKPFVNDVGDSTKDRTTAIVYVANKGVVEEIRREPDLAAPIKLTVKFEYDAFGNRNKETITPSETGAPPDPPERIERVDFDSLGRFPATLTNAKSQATTVTFDPRFGAIATIDGPNASISGFNDLITRRYDDFGRMKDELRPDGSYEVVYFKAVAAGASGSPGLLAKVMIETAIQDAAWENTTPSSRLTPTRVFLDGHGRELRSRTRAFDATNFVHADTEYDSRGRVRRSSEPYYDGQAASWNTPDYDVLGRVEGVVAADSALTTTTDHDRFTITTTDAGGRRNRLISDALGRPTRAEDLDSSSVVLAVTEYLYDKAGNLETTRKLTPGGSVIANTAIVNTYDRLGRRIQTNDRNLTGTQSTSYVGFVYDSIGDLRKQQTPRLRAQSSSLYTEFKYDTLGRLIERKDPSNALTQTVTSTLTYDQSTTNCEAGIGHLTTEAISGGGEVGLTTTYCYSPAVGIRGRLASESRTTSSVTYQTNFTYDVLGRTSQVRYPATTTWPSASRFAVNYKYNARGYLQRVEEAQGTNAVLYQTLGANARGQIEKTYLGDGSRTTRNFIKNTERLSFTNAASGTAQVQNFVYGYDSIGNVTGRADLINSVSEAFGYDQLDRLTSATVTNGTGPHAVTYQYDTASLGNLTHKSDISTLSSASMSYSTTARPHAVTSLNTGSATRTFTYNTNGGMTGGQVDSGTRTIAWTSYDLPSSVTIGTTSRTFSYGADRQRYRQVSVSGGTTRTYTYIGEHYVKEVQGSSTEHKLYVFANGEPVAYVSDDGTPETRYLHKDHLGSITTIVTNQNIAGREKLSYDAWGKRRSGTDWWTAAAAATEERGYTDHEHLDNVSLIHMNGRLLDPKLGRVVSADPFVPEPLSSQSYNRYAYVYNNPLKFTDPSGFGPDDPRPPPLTPLPNIPYPNPVGPHCFNPGQVYCMETGQLYDNPYTEEFLNAMFPPEPDPPALPNVKQPTSDTKALTPAVLARAAVEMAPYGAAATALVIDGNVGAAAKEAALEASMVAGGAAIGAVFAGVGALPGAAAGEAAYRVYRVGRAVYRAREPIMAAGRRAGEYGNRLIRGAAEDVRRAYDRAATAAKETFTYRGDSRAPDVIFNEGFQPRGDSMDLLKHALDNRNPPSGYVATSKLESVAQGFGDNVYVVRPRNGIDVNQTLGRSSPHAGEMEVAIPGPVSPSDIRAVTQGNVSTLNPNFQP